MEQKYSFIDVSGVGNSGKSAVVDLLREIEDLYAPEYWFEFDLIRISGGLLDLRYALLEDWSPVRSHAALVRFQKVCQKMGKNPKPWDILGLATSSGQRYQRRFREQFFTCVRAFLSELNIASYRAEWPYDDLERYPLSLFLRKILRRLGFRQQLMNQVYLVSGDSFDAAAYNLLCALYSSFVPEKTRQIVLNNGFEPFNPIRSLSMLPGAKQIVVIRDPRDIFASGLNVKSASTGDHLLSAPDNDGFNKSFLGTDNPTLFVHRLEISVKHLYAQPDPRILTIRFEELVLCYEATLAKIFTFLNIDPSRHTRKNQSFKPEKSAQGIGIWKKYSDQNTMDLLSSKFPQLLWLD